MGTMVVTKEMLAAKFGAIFPHLSIFDVVLCER